VPCWYRYYEEEKKRVEKGRGGFPEISFIHLSFANSTVPYSAMAQTVQGDTSRIWTLEQAVHSGERGGKGATVLVQVSWRRGGRNGKLRYDGQAETGEGCRGSLRGSECVLLGTCIALEYSTVR